MTRGDAFGAQHNGAPGLVAAELCYYMGPYMRTTLRADGSHFATAARTIGKLFQSDEDGNRFNCHSNTTATAVTTGEQLSNCPNSCLFGQLLADYAPFRFLFHPPPSPAWVPPYVMCQIRGTLYPVHDLRFFSTIRWENPGDFAPGACFAILRNNPVGIDAHSSLP